MSDIKTCVPVTKRAVFILLALLCWFQSGAQHLDGYESTSHIKERMRALALQDIEGLWQFPVNGTVIAVERDDENATRFRIVAVESPFLVIQGGELLGYAYPTTKRGVLDAHLKEIRPDGSMNRRTTGRNRHRFTLTLNESDAIVFTPVKKGFKLGWDWWRLFPYMFRVKVNKIDDRQKGLDGALRLWPRSLTIPPRQPRYL